MASIHRITPCLWFDSEAEDAAQYYAGIFPNSRIVQVTRFGKAGFDVCDARHGGHDADEEAQPRRAPPGVRRHRVTGTWEDPITS
jgi:hypothetical protein